MSSSPSWFNFIFYLTKKISENKPEIGFALFFSPHALDFHLYFFAKYFIKCSRAEHFRMRSLIPITKSEYPMDKVLNFFLNRYFLDIVEKHQKPVFSKLKSSSHFCI